MWTLLRKHTWLLAVAAVVMAFPLTASAWYNFPDHSYRGSSYSQPFYGQPYYYAVPVPYYAPPQPYRSQAAYPPDYYPAENAAPQPYRYQAAYPAAEEPASITLHVPASAQVSFDGVKTRQTGNVRRFVSPPLRPGASYRYSVRVEWKEGAQAVSQTRRLSVQPGDQIDMSFGQSRSNESPTHALTASKASDSRSR